MPGSTRDAASFTLLVAAKAGEFSSGSSAVSILYDLTVVSVSH